MKAQSSETAKSGNSVQSATAAHGVNDFGLKLVADVAEHR
jgi:hypothetical protein